MLYINNIALPEDQQSVIVNNVAAEKVYCNNELVWEYAPYPTCPGYTLYGVYFLSDTVYYNLASLSETVIVTKGSQTKEVTVDMITKFKKLSTDTIISYSKAFYDAMKRVSLSYETLNDIGGVLGVKDWNNSYRYLIPTPDDVSDNYGKTIFGVNRRGKIDSHVISAEHGNGWSASLRPWFRNPF